MLIYLSRDARAGDHAASGHQTISNVTQLSRNVDDSEATDIICKNFLSSFPLEEVPKVLNLILQKMRANGKLTIMDKDFNLIALGIHREDININELNADVFSNTELRSILTCGMVESYIEETGRLRLLSKGYTSVDFNLVYTRV